MLPAPPLSARAPPLVSTSSDARPGPHARRTLPALSSALSSPSWQPLHCLPDCARCCGPDALPILPSTPPAIMDGARTAALKERASPFHPIAATSAPQKVSLDLVKGPYEHRHSLASTAHALLSTLALLIRLPFHLLYHFVFFRSVSPLVQELGRSPLAEVAAVLVRHIFLHLDLATGRFLFSFGLGLPGKWVTTIDTGAVKANWIAPPDGSDRRTTPSCCIGFTASRPESLPNRHMALMT